MSRLQEIAKRRFEILGQTLHKPRQIPVWEFAEMYNVDDVTIKRDLTALRKRGIDIHSVNNEGLVVKGKISPAALRSLIPEYIGISYSVTPYHAATDHLLTEKGQDSVKILTIIQKSIEAKAEVMIYYHGPRERMIVEPVNVYQNEEQWFLIAREGNYSRIIEIAKISGIEMIEDAVLLAANEEVERSYSSNILLEENRPMSVQNLILNKSISFSRNDSFIHFKRDDILRDDRLDSLIDLKIDRMLEYLRGQVSGELEGLIRNVIKRIKGEDGNEEEVSITDLLESVKKLLS